MDEEEKTFTQDELNKILSDRLAKEQKKYSDYDELKAKVTEYEKQISEHEDQISALNTEHEKQIAELNAKIQANETDSVKLRVALDAGLPADLAERLQGTDLESIRADAQKLKEFARPQTAPQYNPEPVETDPKRAGLKKMLSEMKI